MPKGLDKRDARIFATTAAIRPPLIVGFRLQCDAKPLHATRVAEVVEQNPCDADARIVPLCHKPREQVEPVIRATHGRRIQDTFGFLGIARFRLHQLPQTLQLEAAHRLSFSS